MFKYCCEVERGKEWKQASLETVLPLIEGTVLLAANGVRQAGSKTTVFHRWFNIPQVQHKLRIKSKCNLNEVI